MGKAAKRTARERLAEQRRRDAARHKRTRTLTITGIAIVVIAAIVGGGIAIARSRDDTNPANTGKYTGPLAPLTVDPEASTVTMAKPGVTKPELDIYEDFQCPWCKRFEESTGSIPRRLAAQGKVKVVYHLLAFLNPIGSPRASAAASCVPADHWMAYHDALYAEQPAEAQDPKVSAFTVDRLRSIGSGAGLDAKTLRCIGKQTYAADAKANNAKAFKSGISGSPTVFVDGKELPTETILDSAKLTKAITG